MSSAKGRALPVASIGAAGLAGAGVKVPAFLNKLYSMVDDPLTESLIHWCSSGDSFLIPSAELLGRELLPRFFKHSNFSSFIRQLNMYGFRKVSHLETGVLEAHSSTELWEFQHTHFVRHRPDLLPLVQRKKSQVIINATTQSNSSSNVDYTGLVASSTTTTSSSSSHPTASSSARDLSQDRDYPAILSGINSIRSQQDSISQELRALRTNNAQLWTEALASRERHERQQETTSRILDFLAGIFGDGVTGYVAGSGGEAGGSGLREVAMGRNEWERRVDDCWRSKIGGAETGIVEGSESTSAGPEELDSPFVEWGDEEMEEISSTRYHYSPHSPTPDRTPLFTYAPSEPPPSPSIRSFSSFSVETLLTSLDDPVGLVSPFDLTIPSSTSFTPLSPFQELELSFDNPLLPASSSNHPPPETEPYPPSLASSSVHTPSTHLDSSVVPTEDLLSSLLALDGTAASVDPPPCDPRLYETAQGIEANIDTMQSSISSLISSFGLNSARAARLEGGGEVEDDDLDLASFGRVDSSFVERRSSGEAGRGRKRTSEEDWVEGDALKEDLGRVDRERKRARMGEV